MFLLPQKKKMTPRVWWCLLLSSWLLLNDKLIVRADNWDVNKLKKGGPYSQPRFAISLQAHTAAFISSAYCVNTHLGDGIPIGYSRSLCEECQSCTWKLREGFTTESEWQAAVSTEMARLEGGDGHNKKELVGTWIAEAPFSRINFTDAFIDDLSFSLGVTFDKALIVSETDEEEDRGYFVVSGTPNNMDAMWSAGFESLTPIPARLKIDPMLEEAAAAAAAATTACGEGRGDQEVDRHSSSRNSSYNDPHPRRWECDDYDTIHSLHVQIFEPPTASSSSYYTNTTTKAAHHSAAQRLSTAWTGMISTRLGHGKAEVMADGEHHVTVRGLTSSEELYRVALDIAAHGEVHWVAPQGRLTSSNYFASQVVQSGSWFMPSSVGFPEDDETIAQKHSPFSVIGLTGKGQVVGIADTGLDWNSCYFRDENESPTFEWSPVQRSVGRTENKFEIWESTTHRKIRQYVAYMNAEEDEAEGHGTHICGSVAGAPPIDDLGNAHYRGVAPDAKIAFFDRYSKTERRNDRDHMPALLGRYVFPHAYNVGARVYVASFNYGDQNPVFTAMAVSLDKYCNLHQDFLVLVSAGSRGPPEQEGSRTRRRRGEQTISSPAEAKNAVTVGSHSNPGMMDADLGAPDNAANTISVDRNSAKGPTHDGRIKPDVVGPGSSVYSTASSLTAPPGHCSAVYKDGTSSANAIVAGAAVLARQYFTDGYYATGVKTENKKFNPMGALLKAVLVNSARAVGGGHVDQEAIDVPNYAQGWGGVNLASTLVTPLSPKGLQLKVFGNWSEEPCFSDSCPHLIKDSRFFDKYTLKTTADTSGGLPLKITLVWYDVPGSSSSRMALVNDLDLTVTENGSTRQEDTTRHFYANGKSGYDRRNTVEHIQIPDPKPGTTYTIAVRAHRIAMGDLQRYALVISGPFNRSEVSRMYGRYEDDREAERSATTRTRTTGRRRNQRRRGGRGAAATRPGAAWVARQS